MEIDIKLNQEEIRVLLYLIDIAIKSQGILVAESGVVLTKKIQESLNNRQSSKDTLNM